LRHLPFPFSGIYLAKMQTYCIIRKDVWKYIVCEKIVDPEESETDV